MAPLSRPGILAALLVAGGAQAQGTPPAPASPPPVAPVAPVVDMRKVCATLPAEPTEARALAQRSQCLLGGLIPSERRFAEARELARKAMQQGEPAGGFVLFMAFSNDPANAIRQDGKVDLEAYRRLAARPVTERGEQVEAIEGLAFAAGKGHPGAGVLLANYFYDTVAPRNVSRTRAMVDLLARKGQRNALMDKMGREASTIEKAAPATKASVRSFLDAYRAAVAAAHTGYAVQTAGGKCDNVELKSASSGDIQGAEYLPLKGTMVADSYLVKGQWTEFWTFTGCGQEVPVKVSFVADGWGGSSFTAAHNKGQ